MRLVPSFPELDREEGDWFTRLDDSGLDTFTGVGVSSKSDLGESGGAEGMSSPTSLNLRGPVIKQSDGCPRGM